MFISTGVNAPLLVPSHRTRPVHVYLSVGGWGWGAGAGGAQTGEGAGAGMPGMQGPVLLPSSCCPFGGHAFRCPGPHLSGSYHLRNSGVTAGLHSCCAKSQGRCKPPAPSPLPNQGWHRNLPHISHPLVLRCYHISEMGTKSCPHEAATCLKKEMGRMEEIYGLGKEEDLQQE